ncbi:MAG: hypothetical protein JO095_08985, partial [Alphaproteobacteria bacterium]|nr:hypothetical protein [Alphaproteobacteria bacterium]
MKQQEEIEKPLEEDERDTFASTRSEETDAGRGRVRRRWIVILRERRALVVVILLLLVLAGGIAYWLLRPAAKTADDTSDEANVVVSVRVAKAERQ